MIKFVTKILKLLFVSVLLLTTLPAHALVLVNWDKVPIKITLNQGDERRVILDKNVSVGLPRSLEGKLRIQSLGGVLYLKSSEPFAQTRLMVKDMETGEIILLDITGKSRSKTILETIKIVSGGMSQSTDKTAQIDGKAPSAINEQTLPVPVLLTRYAAQSYYAPLRAIEKVPGIKQISMSLPPSLSRLLPQLPVSAQPQATWRLKGYEVVAIKLVNQSERTLNLDARLLQGNFYSATFSHNTLGPKGQPSDTTMVYLVTKGQASNAFLPEPAISLEQRKSATPTKQKPKHDDGGK